MSKMLGIDLNVDNEYIEQVVKDTVLFGISEALEEKNKIVQNLVEAVLNIKVDGDGKPTTSSYGTKYTLLEYHVRKLIEGEVKQQIADFIEEKRPLVRERIKNELDKKATLDKFTENFIDVVSNSLECSWRTKIDVSFTREGNQYE